VSLMFASFSSSPSYQLNSYGVGPGGTSNSSSSTYKLQGSVGEQANGSSSSATKTLGSGSIQTEQLNLPPAPTLSNGSGTYYNKLNVVVNTGGNPTDTTYAIAVSTNSFVTTNYVQATGALGSTPVYQTYSAWLGSSGTFIVGLSLSTTYQVKVAAEQGLFTNTAYGAVATASTVGTSTTLGISPNTINMGTILPGTVTTSSNVAINFATNGNAGGSVYVSGVSTGLNSPTQSHTIAAYSGNLASASEGFGIQITSPTQTSGGPLTAVSPFNGTSNVVGAESTSPVTILTSTAALVGGTANANFQAKPAGSAPAATDYTETLTFVAAGSF